MVYSTGASLPPLNVRVLLFDSLLNKWVIGQRQQNQNNSYWVLDPKIFHGLDNQRFSHWQELPNAPNPG